MTLQEWYPFATSVNGHQMSTIWTREFIAETIASIHTMYEATIPAICTTGPCESFRVIYHYGIPLALAHSEEQTPSLFYLAHIQYTQQHKHTNLCITSSMKQITCKTMIALIALLCITKYESTQPLRKIQCTTEPFPPQLNSTSSLKFARTSILAPRDVVQCGVGVI